jgi:hypothetical protein
VVVANVGRANRKSARQGAAAGRTHGNAATFKRNVAPLWRGPTAGGEGYMWPLDEQRFLPKRSMKRYRINLIQFDGRLASLELEIRPEWEPTVKKLHAESRVRVIANLISDYGVNSIAEKIRDYADVGHMPLSVLAFHNQNLLQIRNAFSIGAYYPALAAACALGERILNELTQVLKTSYPAVQLQPKVIRALKKEACDNWDVMCEALLAWSLITCDTAKRYDRLNVLRNRFAVHYNPDLMLSLRDNSLEAVHLISDIVRDQFSGFGHAPWLMGLTPGVEFIKKGWENDSFIKHFYLPSCVHVGPRHTMKLENGWFVVDQDNVDGLFEGMTDEEFAETYNASHS